LILLPRVGLAVGGVSPFRATAPGSRHVSHSASSLASRGRATAAAATKEAEEEEAKEVAPTSASLEDHVGGAPQASSSSSPVEEQQAGRARWWDRHLIVGLDVNTKSTGVVIIDAETCAVVTAQVVETTNIAAPSVYEKAAIFRRALEALRTRVPVQLGVSPARVRWTAGVEEFLLAIFQTSSAHALFRLAQVNTLMTNELSHVFGIEGGAVNRVFSQTARAHFDLHVGKSRAKKGKKRKTPAKPVAKKKVKFEVDLGRPLNAAFDVSTFDPASTESKIHQKHRVFAFAAPYFPADFPWPVQRHRAPSSSDTGDGDGEQSPTDAPADVPPDVTASGENDGELDDDSAQQRAPRLRDSAYDLTDAFLVAIYTRNFHLLREGRVSWPKDREGQEEMMLRMTNVELQLELRAIGIASAGTKAVLHKKLRRALDAGRVIVDN
jgi:hypothetical protein